MLPLYFAPINVLGNYVYRHLLIKHGADFVFSEMIRIDKIDEQKRKFKVIDSDLDKTIWQVAVSNPYEIETFFYYFDKEVTELNINMGCPDSTTNKKGYGAGVLQDLKHMEAICKAHSKLCKDRNIISSIKIRLGPKKGVIWLDKYLEIASKSEIDKVYVHARTLKESYAIKAHYEDLVGLNQKFPKISIILNGDVDSFEVYDRFFNMGCDGVMIGRAALINPFIFDNIKQRNTPRTTHYNPIQNDLSVKFRHGNSTLSAKKKDFLLDFLSLAKAENMARHLFKTNILYLLKGISGLSKIRLELNESKTFDDIEKVLKRL
jgi:tRNA-dihydrouridine synthase 3